MNDCAIPCHNQRGAALLVIVFAIFAVATTLFLASVNTHAVEIRRQQDVRTELEKARQALIAYAVNYAIMGFDNVDDLVIRDEGPGRLPCPDVDNDGIADSNTTDCTDNVRGRLPQLYTWGTSQTDFNDTYTGIDEQFWYVVSPAFREITTTNINHLTTGSLSIDGVGGYVAVIIAPGDQLSGQDRSNSQTTAANYLEQDNVSGTSFINSYPADPDAFNDQVIGITVDDLMMYKFGGTGSTGVPEYIYEPTRQALYAYWTANAGALPTSASALNTYGQNSGFGWAYDEGYTANTIVSYERYFSPAYVRYKMSGCTSRWYYFIPNFPPYNYSSTYVSGTAC